MKKRDDCPFLVASAEDGEWFMACSIGGNECGSNYNEYRDKCHTYEVRNELQKRLSIHSDKIF